MRKIGFIGVGVMGKSMVRNLMKGGFDVSIYSRTKSKVEDVISEGAVWRPDVRSCAAGKDAVITMVGYPKDVEEVYFDGDGIIENAKPGAYVIDMTTSSPVLAVKIYMKARERGVFALDAPVSGGDVGAKNGTLSIMVGGDREAFDACQPIFACLGKNVIHEGNAGTGQHTKMANQIALAGAISGVCEAVEYSRRVGLDVQTMLDSVSQGAAGSWQMSNMAPRMLKGDFAPGFFIKHYIKDMNIAVAEAERVSLNMGIVNHVLSMYKEMAEKGMGDLGTQALLKYYQGF